MQVALIGPISLYFYDFDFHWNWLSWIYCKFCLYIFFLSIHSRDNCACLTGSFFRAGLRLRRRAHYTILLVLHMYVPLLRLESFSLGKWGSIDHCSGRDWRLESGVRRISTTLLKLLRRALMTMVHMLCQRVMDERRRKRIEEENIIFSTAKLPETRARAFWPTPFFLL